MVSIKWRSNASHLGSSATFTPARQPASQPASKPVRGRGRRKKMTPLQHTASVPFEGCSLLSRRMRLERSPLCRDMRFATATATVTEDEEEEDIPDLHEFPRTSQSQ